LLCLEVKDRCRFAAPVDVEADRYIDMKKIHGFLDAIERRFPGEKTPGYVCAVIREGEVELERTFGYANLEWDAPVAKDTIFHIGSETKQFTACLILRLIDEGWLGLEDDARSILDYCRDFPYELRIVDLVRHTAGVADYVSKNVEILDAHGDVATGFAGGKSYFGMARARQAIAERSALQSRPCREFAYSNSNYIILADVVERIAGKDFASVADDYIFGPLGMKCSFFETARSRVVQRRATAYAPDLRKPGKYLSKFKNFDVVGDVGLLTSADDLVKWERNFWNDALPPGGVIKGMLSFPAVPRPDDLMYGCGMEFGNVSGAPYISHGGRMDGFKCVILRMTGPRVSFIYLSNCDVPFISSEAIGREIASLCA
jgi:CubicO group peptidase (beta-lactamase class C family)